MKFLPATVFSIHSHLVVSAQVDCKKIRLIESVLHLSTLRGGPDIETFPFVSGWNDSSPLSSNDFHTILPWNNSPSSVNGT